MKLSLTIALAVSLVLGVAAVSGSCAEPHRVAREPASSDFPAQPLAHSQSQSGENLWHSTH